MRKNSVSFKDRFVRTFINIFCGLCFLVVPAQWGEYNPQGSNVYAAKLEHGMTSAELERIKEEKYSKQLFGYELFKIDVDKIPPGPIDKTYMLAPRDKIVLKTWGELQLDFVLEVSDDLYISIPEAGRVYVGGLSLKEVDDRVRRQMSTVYSSFINADDPSLSSVHIDIALAEVQNIRFLIQGEVNNPGSYSLHPSLANLIYAIARAGGIKDTGSLRNIKIMRGDSIVRFDFYDLLIQGNTLLNQVKITNNDVIFIPIKTGESTLIGEVRRPGTYELLEGVETDLDELIKIAGGLKPSASLEKVSVLRIEVNKGEMVVDVDLTTLRKENKRFFVKDGDVISIFSTLGATVRREYVTVEGGGVLYPNDYQYREGMKASDLIRAAGGLRDNAYLELVDLVRINKKDYTTKEYLTVNVQKIMNGDKISDVPLEPLDKMVIYTFKEIEGGERFVELKGHVKIPGRYPLYKKMRLYDLLFSKGGFRDKDFLMSTYLEEACILRSSNLGKNEYKELLSFNLGRLLQGDQTENHELRSGDVVIIRENPHFREVKTVEIKGEVNFPGEYPLVSENEKISGLIKRAGGLKPTAFVDGTEFLRAKKEKEESLEKGAQRLIIDLNTAISNPGGTQDIILEDGDRVVIPKFISTIKIEGEVNFPTSMVLPKKSFIRKKLAYYIENAGGVTDMADVSRIIITYPNGSRKKISKPGARPKIEPGCTIYVPKTKTKTKTKTNISLLLPKSAEKYSL